jgi:hypothetical protein
MQRASQECGPGGFIVFVISSVMADARPNAEIDGISCRKGIKCVVDNGGLPAT